MKRRKLTVRNERHDDSDQRRFL